MWGQSAYAPKADVSTTQGAIAVLPVGLAYLLFAPFPWAVHNVRQALTVPETLVWYALMPALLRGLLFDGGKAKVIVCGCLGNGEGSTVIAAGASGAAAQVASPGWDAVTPQIPSASRVSS